MALFRIPFSFVFIIIIIDNNNIIIIARVSHINFCCITMVAFRMVPTYHGPFQVIIIIIIIARVSHIRARERKSVGASPIYELNAA